MAHKRGRNRPKNKNVNTQNTKMEQNTEKQETEAKAEESVQNDENLSDTDTNAAETDSKDGQQTENVADSAAEKASEAEKAADQPAEKEEDWHGKYDELNDKYLRLMAEFDNYRKRVMKEKSELIKTAGANVITTILPVIDDMERAEQNMEKVEDVASLKEGLLLIFDKFLKLMASQGLKKIDTTDKVFDTDYHEAVAMVPGQPDDKKGKVIDCIQTGYTLNDKVIRHAKVAVAQ